MQTIATKLAAVKSIAAAEGWADNELRALIHGCGGSPRRAKRILRADQAVAKVLSESYANAIAEGMHHVHAVAACNQQFAEMFPRAAEPSDEEAPQGWAVADTSVEDEAEAQFAAADAWANGDDKSITPSKPLRRASKPAVLTEQGIAALKALA